MLPHGPLLLLACPLAAPWFYRPVPDADRTFAPWVRPHSLLLTIGRLAAAYVRSGAMPGAGGLTRRILSLLDVGEATEADLASYLLFDGAFAKKLIDLGRADAEARRHYLGAGVRLEACVR